MADDSTRAPRVDARSTDTLVVQTEALLLSLTGGAWAPAAAGQACDPLGALVRVFAGMACHLVDAVNATPDACFDAYLRLVGALAPRRASARAPLRFRLVDGAPVDGVVPAGTQVGPAEVDQADPTPLLFETEEELIVTRSRLVGTFAHDPAQDRLDVGDGVLSAFAPQTPANHELLIACPIILSRARAASWSVRLEFDAPPTGLTLSWSGLTTTGRCALAPSVSLGGTALVASFTGPPALVAADPGADAWLSASLVRQGPPPAVPKLKKVILAATFSAAGVAPAQVVRGAALIDATAAFYPFDAEPVLGKACAFDCGEILAQPPGASVAIDLLIEAAAPAPRATADLQVVWEQLAAGGAWNELGRSSAAQAAIQSPVGFSDTTLALTRSGRVSFQLPFTAPEGRHQGKSGRWLRVRLVAGGYEAGFPPQLGGVTLSFQHDFTGVLASRCVASDRQYLRDLGVRDGSTSIAVFTVDPEGAPALGDRPALYFAFDRAFARRPVQLYLDVLTPEAAATEPPESFPPASDAPRVEWEYMGARGWTRLGVRDGTDALSRRGVVRFLGPPDLATEAIFGVSAVWMRARWVSGVFRAPPKLGAAVLNAVWAVHAALHADEVLGSGTGAPDQRLTLVSAPVLAGERIEVRERDEASERDLEDLRRELGDDAVVVLRDAGGAVTGVWVRWTGVADFQGSGPADRHYVLDPERGEVRFGDGLAGRPPPRGHANVRAAAYRSGGGARGNLPPGSLTQLKSAHPYIDGVDELAAAAGGADSDDHGLGHERELRRLRHGGRAVTAQDLEDLACEASSEVARACAVTVAFDPTEADVDLTGLSDANRNAMNTTGWVSGATIPADTAELAGRSPQVRLIIVPRGDVDQPVPSLGLLAQVQDYLQGRCSPALRLHVSGPRWIRVSVRATLAARPGAGAEGLLAGLYAAIQRFVHPLTGGELGLGWDFGRGPQRSNFFRLLARQPGVHHIRSLSVVTEPPLPEAGEALTDEQRRALVGALVYSGTHELTLVDTED